MTRASGVYPAMLVWLSIVPVVGCLSKVTIRGLLTKSDTARGWLGWWVYGQDAAQLPKRSVEERIEVIRKKLDAHLDTMLASWLFGLGGRN